MLYSAKTIFSCVAKSGDFTGWFSVCWDKFRHGVDFVKVRSKATVDYYVSSDVAEFLVLKGKQGIFVGYDKLSDNGLDALKKAILKSRILNIFNMAKIKKETGIVANDSSNVPQIFSNDQFGQIRIIMQDNGDPLFCLKDACDCSGLKQPSKVASRLDKDDVHSIPLTDTTGREQEMLFVTESGLYDAMLSARNNQKTKPFKKWVTKDVLPSIRKTGSYAVPQTKFAIPTSYAEALRLAADKAEFAEKETKRADKAEAEKQKLENKVENDRPKVDFADAIMSTDAERDLTQLVMECLKFGNIQCLHPNAALKEMQSSQIIYKTKNGVFRAYGKYKHLFREREDYDTDRNGRKRSRPVLRGVLNDELREVLVNYLNPEICPRLYIKGNVNINKIRDVQNGYKFSIGYLV